MVSFNGKNGHHKQFKMFGEDGPPAEPPVFANQGPGMGFFLFTDIHMAAVMFQENENLIKWITHQIIAYEENEVGPAWPGDPKIMTRQPVFRDDEDPDSEEGTTVMENAMEFMRFQVQANGCSDFLFFGDDEEGWAHSCSGEQVQAVGILLTRLYEISQRIFRGEPPLPG